MIDDNSILKQLKEENKLNPNKAKNIIEKNQNRLRDAKKKIDIHTNTNPNGGAGPI